MGRSTALPLSFILVELVYVWLVSVGLWVAWPSTTTFYDSLANAFVKGQTALLIEPSPRLAQLENPWPTAEREGIPVVGDASYFRGKYYLYWGPAPAALVALWKLATRQTVGDQYIVFLAVSAILLFSSLTLLYIKRRYFPSLPGWLLVSGLTLVATVHPMLYVLNRPAIYEAAIASGQGFLLAGLYFGLPVLDGSQRQPWRCCLVGVLWSLALGSRLTLIGAIAILTLAMCTALLSSGGGRFHLRGAAASIATLGFPIALSLGLLAMYNFIRFGSVLESGMRYQMSVNDLSQLSNQGLIFNPAYLPANMFYYLATPLRLRPAFPFVRPTWEQVPQVTRFLKRFGIPGAYRVEDITGLLFAAPAVLFMFPIVRNLVCGHAPVDPRSEEAPSPKTSPERDRPMRRLLTVLLVAGFLAGAPSFFFFWAATRYLLDAVPLLAMAVALGLWLLYEANRAYPLRRKLTAMAIILAVIAGLLAGFLLAVSGSDSRFDDLNPALWESLRKLFMW